MEEWKEDGQVKSRLETMRPLEGFSSQSKHHLMSGSGVSINSGMTANRPDSATPEKNKLPDDLLTVSNKGKPSKLPSNKIQPSKFKHKVGLTGLKAGKD